MADNSKRDRQRNRQETLRAARAQRERRERRRKGIVAGVLAAIMVLGIVALVSGGGGGDTDLATTGPSTTTSVTTVTTAVTTEPPPACPPSEGTAERRVSFPAAPAMCIDPSLAYEAVVDTTLGTFSITLDAEAAPVTVNNFVFLARHRYFDGVVFHRIIPDFVVQGGDPEGTGRGGPGYRFDDELPDSGAYQLGSVAMANSGPDTNGSQFFVVTGPNGMGLPPQYSLFGMVTTGLEVVEAIEAVGTPSGAPTEIVTINSIKITEA